MCVLAADDTCKLTCENGGKCIINEKGDPRCHCWPSYSGERCEKNHCYNYCQNGGTCGASLLGKYFWAAVSYCYSCLNFNVCVYSLFVIFCSPCNLFALSVLMLCAIQQYKPYIYVKVLFIHVPPCFSRMKLHPTKGSMGVSIQYKDTCVEVWK